MKLLAKLFGKSDPVKYEIVDRGGYHVVRRIYPNGNVKSDRLATGRARSTLRTAVHGRAFG